MAFGPRDFWMHRQPVAEQREQVVEVQLPPGRIVLPGVTRPEALTEIGVLWKRHVPALQFIPDSLPHDAGCPIHEREAVLGVEGRRRIGSLALVE